MANDKHVWSSGVAPVAVVMISLNEAHNMESVLKNLSGWAQEVFLVDSCSSDDTVNIALRYGVHVVQRRFKGFGDQWNFALESLPVTAPWTMKLDPDERLTDELKLSLTRAFCNVAAGAFNIKRRLWFIGRVLPIEQNILRVWRTGTCHFTDVLVNEHPMVSGAIIDLDGYLEHHDSPDLDHWIIKQNRYTTAEAISQANGNALSVSPRLFGNSLQRRMWFKKNFWFFPGRYFFLFIYHYIFLGSWRAGRIGWIWAHLRTEVYRLWEYKSIEIKVTGRLPSRIPSHPGEPDSRVPFFD